jgi:hypothetical protein
MTNINNILKRLMDFVNITEDEYRCYEKGIYSKRLTFLIDNPFRNHPQFFHIFLSLNT